MDLRVLKFEIKNWKPETVTSFDSFINSAKTEADTIIIGQTYEYLDETLIVPRSG
jgi:hypothetical protein